MSKSNPTRRQTQARAEQRTRGERIRAEIHSRASAIAQRQAEKRRERAAERAEKRREGREAEVVHRTGAEVRMVSGRHVYAPYRNPERILKLYKAGRLRPELHAEAEALLAERGARS